MTERKHSLTEIYGQETVQIGENILKRTKNILIDKKLVSKSNLKKSFFDFPFEYKGRNYSFTHIEDNDYFAISLNHMRAKGPFTRTNMEEGFSLKIDLRREKGHFPSAEIAFSGTEDEEFFNNWQAVDKINKFLDRLNK